MMAFLALILSLLVAPHFVTCITVFPPTGNTTELSRECLLEGELLRPSITPKDLHGSSWEEVATRHLIEWLPLQKTTTSRSAYEFTGAHMCPPIAFGGQRTDGQQQRSMGRVLWFTAITAPEKVDTARSENYLNGVRVMVLSAVRNSPSLIPVVIYLGGRKDDCFVSWLTQHGAYVLVVGKLSFMGALPKSATDHSSASMANHGAFSILDMPRFFTQMWKDFGVVLSAQRCDREYALFTDADMLFTGDVNPHLNMAADPEQFPPKLMLVLSERWWPHVVREGFNTAAYYLNMSAFGEAMPSFLRFAVDKEWKFSEGLRDQGLFNDFFRAYSNSPGPHRHELLDATLRPQEMHPYFGWRPYGGANLKGRINESGKSGDGRALADLLKGALPRFVDDSPRIWHFHGGKIWEMRCYLAENAMSWARGITISAQGTAHCHGIRQTSHKGFMVSSLSNPHIYISPCALLNYARLLDYYDAILSGDAAHLKALVAAGGSGGGSSGAAGGSRGGRDSKLPAVLTREEGNHEVYLWAVDRLRRQVQDLGATPAVYLPPVSSERGR